MTEPINLICDRCRAEGVPGIGDFASIGDLLSFEPVPRRKRVGGWDAEAQRWFIAALAMCGSPVNAAHALGRSPHGIERLRESEGNEGFLAAYDRALALYRDKAKRRAAAGLAALARADREPEAVPQEPAPPVTEETRERLAAEAMHRAIHGTEQPVFHGGRQIGTRRVYSDSLAVQLLRAGANGGGEGGGGARGGVVLNALERQIHKLLVENPQWTRAYAERRAKARGGIWSHYPEPWRFGRQDELAWELTRLHDAFCAAIEADPERERAFELLAVREPIASDFMAALGHAVTAFELLLPDMLGALAALLKRPEILREVQAQKAAEAAGLPAPNGEQGADERREGDGDGQG